MKRVLLLTVLALLACAGMAVLSIGCGPKPGSDEWCIEIGKKDLYEISEADLEKYEDLCKRFYMR